MKSNLLLAAPVAVAIAIFAAGRKTFVTGTFKAVQIVISQRIELSSVWSSTATHNPFSLGWDIYNNTHVSQCVSFNS